MTDTKELVNNVESLKLTENGDGPQQEDVVDPWTVTSSSDTGVDYDKLTSEYRIP